ncbi:hypothetical protein ND16A_0314 [Thalassotalea sp. ND16A]|nr:hypothetical protein ND16A_0314 [Thalassotalea sp. ND16A]
MFKFFAAFLLFVSALSSAMNKAELIDAMASDTQLSKEKLVKPFVNSLIDVAREQLNHAGPGAAIEFQPFGHILNALPKKQDYHGHVTVLKNQEQLEFNGHVTVLKAADGTFELSILPQSQRLNTVSVDTPDSHEVAVTLVFDRVISPPECLSAGVPDNPKSCRQSVEEQRYIGHVTLLRGVDANAAGGKEFIGHVTLLRGSDSDFRGHVTVLKAADHPEHDFNPNGALMRELLPTAYESEYYMALADIITNAYATTRAHQGDIINLHPPGNKVRDLEILEFNYSLLQAMRSRLNNASSLLKDALTCEYDAGGYCADAWLSVRNALVFTEANAVLRGWDGTYKGKRNTRLIGSFTKATAEIIYQTWNQGVVAFIAAARAQKATEARRTKPWDDIIQQIPMNARYARILAASFINTTTNALKRGDRVSLVGFGSFSVSNRAARTGRNPQTGKEIQIAAKKVVRFKAGSELSTKVN